MSWVVLASCAIRVLVMKNASTNIGFEIVIGCSPPLYLPQCLGQSFAGDRVDARTGGSRYRFVPGLTKLLDNVRSDESAAANHHDFHNCLSFPCSFSFLTMTAPLADGSAAPISRYAEDIHLGNCGNYGRLNFCFRVTHWRSWTQADALICLIRHAAKRTTELPAAVY